VVRTSNLSPSGRVHVWAYARIVNNHNAITNYHYLALNNRGNIQ